MSSLFDRFHAGAKATDFTPAEAGAFAQQLMTRASAVYRDPKHPDHAELNRAVVELMKHAHPGFVGSGGEVVTAPGTAPGSGETLFNTGGDA